MNFTVSPFFPAWKALGLCQSQGSKTDRNPVSALENGLFLSHGTKTHVYLIPDSGFFLFASTKLLYIYLISSNSYKCLYEPDSKDNLCPLKS